MSMFQKRVISTTLLLGTSLALARPAAAQQANLPETVMSHSYPMTEAIEIPESIRAEHAEIHAALERAMEAAGRVGEAACALAKVLHPHFRT